MPSLPRVADGIEAGLSACGRGAVGVNGAGTGGDLYQDLAVLQGALASPRGRAAKVGDLRVCGDEIAGYGGAHEPVVGFGDHQMDAAVAQRGEAEAEAVEAVDPSGSEPIQLDPVVDVAVGDGGWHG